MPGDCQAQMRETRDFHLKREVVKKADCGVCGKTKGREGRDREVVNRGQTVGCVEGQKEGKAEKSEVVQVSVAGKFSLSTLEAWCLSSNP